MQFPNAPSTRRRSTKRVEAPPIFHQPSTYVDVNKHGATSAFSKRLRSRVSIASQMGRPAVQSGTTRRRPSKMQRYSVTPDYYPQPHKARRMSVASRLQRDSDDYTAEDRLTEELLREYTLEDPTTTYSSNQQPTGAGNITGSILRPLSGTNSAAMKDSSLPHFSPTTTTHHSSNLNSTRSPHHHQQQHHTTSSTIGDNKDSSLHLQDITGIDADSILNGDHNSHTSPTNYNNNSNSPNNITSQLIHPHPLPPSLADWESSMSPSAARHTAEQENTTRKMKMLLLLNQQHLHQIQQERLFSGELDSRHALLNLERNERQDLTVRKNAIYVITKLEKQETAVREKFISNEVLHYGIVLKMIIMCKQEIATRLNIESEEQTYRSRIASLYLSTIKWARKQSHEYIISMKASAINSMNQYIRNTGDAEFSEPHWRSRVEGDQKECWDHLLRLNSLLLNEKAHRDSLVVAENLQFNFIMSVGTTVASTITIQYHILTMETEHRVALCYLYDQRFNAIFSMHMVTRQEHTRREEILTDEVADRIHLVYYHNNVLDIIRVMYDEQYDVYHEENHNRILTYLYERVAYYNLKLFQNEGVELVYRRKIEKQEQLVRAKVEQWKYYFAAIQQQKLQLADFEELKRLNVQSNILVDLTVMYSFEVLIREELTRADIEKGEKQQRIIWEVAQFNEMEYLYSFSEMLDDEEDSRMELEHAQEKEFRGIVRIAIHLQLEEQERDEVVHDEHYQWSLLYEWNWNLVNNIDTEARITKERNRILSQQKVIDDERDIRCNIIVEFLQGILQFDMDWLMESEQHTRQLLSEDGASHLHVLLTMHSIQVNEERERDRLTLQSSLAYHCMYGDFTDILRDIMQRNYKIQLTLNRGRQLDDSDESDDEEYEQEMRALQEAMSVAEQKLQQRTAAALNKNDTTSQQSSVAPHVHTTQHRPSVASSVKSSHSGVAQQQAHKDGHGSRPPSTTQNSIPPADKSQVEQRETRRRKLRTKLKTLTKPVDREP